MIFLLRAGDIFHERYKLVRKLGSGGFSEVWLAEDSKSNNMQIALKVFAVSTGLDTSGLSTFSSEYSLVFNLNHPNLLKPMHFDDWQGRPYLVMQYMPAGNCASSCGSFTEKALAHFILQIGSALDYLHRRPTPVVHQDIKPDNILINDEGVYMLTDFGISTNIRRTLTRSMGQSSSGTTAFMAPERFSDDLDKRKPQQSNDIFSFGVSLFELLTGELPYGEQGGVAVYSNIRPAQLPSSFSSGLKNIINACLATDPHSRPTAAQLVQAAKKYEETGIWDLKGLSNSRGLSGVEGPPPSPPKK